MAKDVERLVLELSADVSRLERGLKAGGASTSRYARQTEKRFDEMNRRTSRSVADMTSSITRMVGLLGAAFSVQAVVRYADAYTNLQNRLKAVGLEGERLANIENELFAAANRNGVAVDAVTQLFQRASLSREQLGATDEQLIALTNGVSAALRVQGVSAQAAQGPLLQLGQALGAGTVRAEELNSLLEGTPIILQAAAKGSTRFAGDMQAMAKAVRDGKVSSQELFQALLVGLPALEEQAATLPKTVGQAMQILDNELGRFIGRTDESLSASARLAQGIEGLAKNLDTVALVVGVVATLVGTKYALALAAAAGQTLLATAASVRYQIALVGLAMRQGGVTAATVLSTAATRAFSAALAANPIGAVIVAVAALSAAIIFLGDKLAITGEATRDVKVANDALAAATAAYTEASNAAAIATGREAVAARQAAAEKRALAVAARDAARAKLAEAAATVALIQAEASRQLDLERRAPIRGDRPGSVQTISRAERERLANAEVSAAASRGAIAAANKAIADADAAIRRRAPASPSGAAAGGGRGGGGRANAISQEAQDLERLRQEISTLSEELMSDTERAASDLAKVRDTLRRAVAAGLLTVEQASRIEGGAAAQGMTLPDRPTLNPLDDNARYIAEQLRGGREAQSERFEEQGRDMARAFVDILAADDIGTEIGNRFRLAAFDGIEKVLGNLFSQLFAQQAGGGGGGIFATIASAMFGGNRALGGPVKAGMAYRVNENTPNSEIFVPNRDGWVGNMKQPRGGARAVQNITVRNELYLAGANGDSVIYGNVRAMLAASQRQTVAAIKAGAPSAQLEQTLLRE
jgi:tape measure domain-containing protein